MATSSESLARQITRDASAHTYTTIQLLVSRRRAADAMRAYAYFRWVDDCLDAEGMTAAQAEPFLERQRQVIEAAQRRVDLPDASREEAMLVDLVRGNGLGQSGLSLYIDNLMQVMAFDAARRGRPITADELAAHTRRLAIAVTEALDYFLDGRRSSRSPAKYLAASGAHIAHMLRDTREDIARGYFNIPLEVLRAGRIEPDQVDSQAYRAWAERRVALARRCLRLGRAYILRLDSFRLRMGLLGYALRFERLLDAIERNDLRLDAGLGDEPRLATQMELLGVALLAARRPSVRGAARSSIP
jgi:phytoene/squalene synthetase